MIPIVSTAPPSPQPNACGVHRNSTGIISESKAKFIRGDLTVVQKIKKELKVFLIRSFIGALVGTFLALIILPKSPYAKGLLETVIFVLMVFIFQIPFTTFVSLLIGGIIWWIQQKAERNFGFSIRLIIGATIGLSIGCMVGALNFYINFYRGYDEIQRSIVGTSYLFDLIKYFGFLGLILGASTGAIVGNRYHINSIVANSVLKPT